MMFDNAGPLMVAGLMLGLAGCGSLFGKNEPSPGDLMIAKGEAVADLGKMWNEGHEMVDRADSLAAEGAGLKKRGRRDLEEGRNLTERSRTIIEEQQREYARFAKTIGPLVTLERARGQRDHLDRIVEKWHEGRKGLNEGRKLTERGRSRIAEGEAKLAESDRLRRRGHGLMQKAELRYEASGTVPAQLTQ